jgi:hypothetical protein
MSMPMSANLTTEPSFTPRKEFLRIPLPAPDSFALLALSSANCIRLYSFPASVIDALRHLFEQLSIILSSREDSPQGLYEFALEGKPWANTKSIFTEKLLLDILAVFYQYGYSYLSTIDYGREIDDRLAMVFSKPGTAPILNSQTTNPLPSIPTNSTSHLNGKEKVQLVPFALSFTSTTLMRVIAPPLHLTPAILQAVRASWPRGVVSEKKVGDNSFEFKLKGYKWFQQDTFATDSLRHILALLTSLDSHSFSLLTSLSLAKRSRVKDLWIFTGPAPELSLPVETPKPTTSVIRLPLQGFSTEEKRPIDIPQQYSRTSPQRSQYPVISSPQPRKPAPRAQVPVSVFRDSDIPDEHHPVLRAHIPSTISTGTENMTGVGAVGVKQDLLSASSSPGTLTPKAGGQATFGRSDLRLGSDKVATSPLSTSPLKQPLQSNAKNEKPIHSTNDLSSPPLLGMNVFRDSAISSNSTTATTLTGSHKKNAKLEREPTLNSSYVSSGFPGGWQSRMVDEKIEEETEFSTSEKDTALTAIHENDCRREAPAIIPPDISLRKSEAALIGMITSTSIPQSHMPRPKESQNSLSSGGQGWVLVNVEGSSAVGPAFGSESALPNDADESNRLNSPLSLSASAPNTSKSPVFEQPSPAAKAIAIIDAMDSKQKKRSTMQPKESGEGRTGLKRFFSLNKKNLR